MIIRHCLYCPLQQAYLLEEGATNSLRAKQNQCKRDIPFLLYPKSTSILGRKDGQSTKHRHLHYKARFGGQFILVGF